MIDLLAFKEQLKVEQREGTFFIHDPVRRKWVKFTPEEAVRQTFIQYAHAKWDVSFMLMSTERGIPSDKGSLRFDLAIFNRNGDVRLLVECKSYKVPLNEQVTGQIARYNQHFVSDYLCITNGLDTYFWTYADGAYHQIPEIQKLTTD